MPVAIPKPVWNAVWLMILGAFMVAAWSLTDSVRKQIKL